MNNLSSNETKKILLNMLIYVDKVLTDNNLNYSLAYGTLLGAVRHKGFIPWDDDLDIVMPFDDYLKMLKLPEFNNKGRYTVHYAGNLDSNDEKRYNYPFAKIEDNYTKCIFKNTNDEGGAFLDIFPLTPLPKDSAIEYAQKLTRLHNRLVFTYTSSDSLAKKFAHKISSPLYWIFRNKMTKLAFMYINSTDYELLSDATWSDNRIKEAMPKEWFRSYTRLEFCGNAFKVIKNYEKWLELVYGNWKVLPPKEKRVGHHDFKLYLNKK